MGRTVCTEPQCLYKGALYFTAELYLYSPYGSYGQYRASVPVQGCTLIYSSAIPLLPLWAVRSVQSLSACTLPAAGLASVEIIQTPESPLAKPLHRRIHFLTYSYQQRMSCLRMPMPNSSHQQAFSRQHLDKSTTWNRFTDANLTSVIERPTIAFTPDTEAFHPNC